MSRERPFDRDDATEPLPRRPRRSEDPDATEALPAGSWAADDPNATVPLGGPRGEPWDGDRLDHEPTEVLEDNRTLPLGAVPADDAPRLPPTAGMPTVDAPETLALIHTSE
ncbi:hypothetical protein NBM05_04615, partial [Rothia sp. AR01]